MRNGDPDVGTNCTFTKKLCIVLYDHVETETKISKKLPAGYLRMTFCEIPVSNDTMIRNHNFPLLPICLFYRDITSIIRCMQQRALKHYGNMTPMRSEKSLEKQCT